MTCDRIAIVGMSKRMTDEIHLPVIEEIERSRVTSRLLHFGSLLCNVVPKRYNGAPNDLSLSNQEVCQVVVVCLRVEKRACVLDRGLAKYRRD